MAVQYETAHYVVRKKTVLSRLVPEYLRQLSTSVKGEQGSKSILDPCVNWENKSHF